MTSAFTLVEPLTLSEAANALMTLGPRARSYSGGVRLLLEMRQGQVKPSTLVNLKRIPELQTITSEGDCLRIGACVTLKDTIAACQQRGGLSVVVDAMSAIGNVRVRNTGTVGGSLAVADPHGDPATALLLYDAEVTLHGVEGDRRIPLRELHVGPFKTSVGEGEFISAIHVRPLGSDWSAVYQRVQRLIAPTLTAAVGVVFSEGTIQEARVSIGSVSPTALRLGVLEDALRGLAASDVDALVESHRDTVAGLTTPVTDLWGTAAYRTYISQVVLRRTIHQAIAFAGMDNER